MTSTISQLQSLLEADHSELRADLAERRRALHLIQKLQTELESPGEQVRRLVWILPAYTAALKICLDLGIFEILGEDDGFVTSQALSMRTGADVSLLQRLLRHIAAMGGLREQEPDSYASTMFSNAMRRKEINAGIEVFFDLIIPTFSALPGFLAKTEYKQPVDEGDTAWMKGKTSDLGFFDYMNVNPQQRANFANHMSGYTEDRGSWLDIYPMERIFKDASGHGPLIVDVGGSRGHDMLKFQRHAPQSPDRVIVQDLPGVIEGSSAVEGITMMSHDFFKPQPVKDARAYYLHSVLHDWPDEKALEILKNLRTAFKVGYSKLLISESLIPNTGADAVLSGLDLILMGGFNARERTLEQWERLLSKAGFRITGVWTNTSLAYESLIEAVANPDGE